METDKKKGVKSRNKTVVVDYLPTDYKNKSISKADFVSKRLKEKEAKKAAKEAYASTLASQGVTVEEDEKAQELSSSEQEIASLKKRIKETKLKIESNPDSVYHKKNLEKLVAELDDLEDGIEQNS